MVHVEQRHVHDSQIDRRQIAGALDAGEAESPDFGSGGTLRQAYGGAVCGAVGAVERHCGYYLRGDRTAAIAGRQLQIWARAPLALMHSAIAGSAIKGSTT
jgi:hypothetical protein